MTENLVNQKKYSSFAPAFKHGALDEWLSQRSAKPSTAVRSRHAPQEIRYREMADFLFFGLGDDKGTFDFNQNHINNGGIVKKCHVFINNNFFLYIFAQ